jgi:hypothetical protein
MNTQQELQITCQNFDSATIGHDRIVFFLGIEPWSSTKRYIR